MRRDGFFIAGCEELNLLCDGEQSEKERIALIEQLVIREGWDLEWLPDSTVRFTYGAL